MSTRYIVLDTETTGLEPKQGHKIIEIGCVEIIERRLTGKHYQQFLNPQREIDTAALEVHGITLEELEDKPIFAQIAEDFLSYIKGATLIIHNAAFDVGFLNHELALLEPPLGRIEEVCEVIDTLQMAREIHPGQRNSLDALCQRYFVDNAHRTLHGALLDAEILADVYLLMTGGQLNLLGEHDISETAKNELQEEHMIDKNRAPLKVIPASEEELQAHEKWLTLLSEKTDTKINW